MLETENVTAVRVLAMAIFGPGDLRTLYFFERSSPDAWGYYSLAGVDPVSTLAIQGREASYVNRAVAIFRHVAGLPTDQEPPAALDRGPGRHAAARRGPRGTPRG